MRNREKYAKEILDIACSGDKLAMRKDDKCLTGCAEIRCCDCCFSGTGRCYEVIYEWSDTEPWKIEDLKALEVCDEY